MEKPKEQNCTEKIKGMGSSYKRGTIIVQSPDGIGHEHDISELALFDVEYVKELEADCAVLERCLNTVLQNEKMDKEIIDTFMDFVGKGWFYEFDDGTYIWKGFGGRR